MALAALSSVSAVFSPAAAVAAPPPAGGTVIVDETFSGSSVPDPAWRIDGVTCLTGTAPGASPPAGAAQIPSCQNHHSGPVPPAGTVPGYLQLTDTQGNVAGDILYQRPIPSTAGLSVVFEQYQYGGNEADGIGFFLVDGATTASAVGGSGGSLGYAQKSGAPGVPGGYIGVGLDVYGNYYDDGETRGQNCPAGQRSPAGNAVGRVAPNVVTLRGPGNGVNGYCYLASTTTGNGASPTSTLPGSLRGPAGTTTPPPAKRLVNVQITPSPDPRVIVQIDFTGTGTTYQEVLNQPAPNPVPATYKFGFLGSTGGNNDVHLLRNVVVRTIDPLDELQLVKQISRAGPALPPVITAGTVIPYQYVVTNAGNQTVTNLTVTDDKVSNITCPVTVLPPQPDPAGTVVCTGNYTVTASDVTAGIITNVAQAHAVSPNGTVDSNDATVTLPLKSSLSITKSVGTPPPYSIGQVITYNYVVTNTGGMRIGQLAVNDNRVGTGKVVCQANSLDAGQSTTCSGTYTIQSGPLTPAGLLTNTATAQGFTTLGQNVQSNQAQATINVSADIAVTKTVSNATPTVGDPVTFTVTVRNNGPGLGAGVVIADQIPPGLTLQSASPSAGTYANDRWTLPTLAVGQSETLDLTVTVDTASAVVNGATVASAAQPDPNANNNSASAGINPVTPTVDIAVTKSVDQSSIRVGHTATFTVSATNNGPFPATGVSLLDPLPALLRYVSSSATQGTYSAATGLWTIGSLAVGQTVSLTLVAQGQAVGTTSNTAGLYSVSPQDINQLNDTAVANLMITPPLADLVVAKAVAPDPVFVGDTVTYTVTAYNIGPDPAPTVTVSEIGPIPSGLEILGATASQGTFDEDALVWTVGRLEPGAPAETLTVMVRVLTAGTKVNSVVITDPSVTDPDLSNNGTTTTLTGNEPPLDIAVTKSAGSAQITLGAQTTFTVTAENLGPSNATGLVLQDTLPSGLTFVSSSGDGSYDDATGIWTIGALADGATVTLSIVVRANQAGSWLNVAALRSVDQSDTNNANNSASADVTVVEEADLVIAKSVTPTVATLGDVVTYTVTVRNDGPNDTTDVVAADPSPINADIISVDVTQGAFDGSTRVWTIGALASGDSVTLTAKVKVNRGGTYVNTVQITQSKVPDPDLTNNTAQATLAVPLADLVVTKTVDVKSIPVGATAVFHIHIANLGPDAATAVIVTDPLPDGVEVVSAQASVGAYANGVWTVGDMLPGDEQTLSITVRAVTPGTKTNVAAGTGGPSSPPDPNPSNNAGTAAVKVVQPPVPSASPTAEPGLPGTGPRSPAPVVFAGLVMVAAGVLLLLLVRRIRAEE